MPLYLGGGNGNQTGPSSSLVPKFRSGKTTPVKLRCLRTYQLLSFMQLDPLQLALHGSRLGIYPLGCTRALVLPFRAVKTYYGSGPRDLAVCQRLVPAL